MRKIKLGIIGAGLVWEKKHKAALNKLKNLFEVYAFCATTLKTKNKVQKEYPEALFFYDYKEIVKNKEIDAIVVLTPISLNSIVSISALDAKKDVIIEKPMAPRSLTENANLNFLDTIYSSTLYCQTQHAVVIISKFLFSVKLLV